MQCFYSTANCIAPVDAAAQVLPPCLCCITVSGQQLVTDLPVFARAAHGKREAERLRVQDDLAEVEKRGTELRGLLAMYSHE